MYNVLHKHQAVAGISIPFKIKTKKKEKKSIQTNYACIFRINATHSHSISVRLCRLNIEMVLNGFSLWLKCQNVGPRPYDGFIWAIVCFCRLHPTHITANDITCVAQYSFDEMKISLERRGGIIGLLVDMTNWIIIFCFHFLCLWILKRCEQLMNRWYSVVHFSL